MERQFTVTTPIGPLYITVFGGCVTRIAMSVNESVELADTLLDAEAYIKRQIEEYFYNGRTAFDFPFEIRCGTPFQQRVWRELCRIPFGTTGTYGDIAQRIGKRGAARAVGAACNRNPLLLVVPCHRVVGKGGGLVGFACGVKVKSRLLEIEGGCFV